MTCPVCGYQTKVVNSREDEDGDGIRRRRECLRCRHRFTTLEVDKDYLDRLSKQAMPVERKHHVTD